MSCSGLTDDLDGEFSIWALAILGSVERFSAIFEWVADISSQTDKMYEGRKTYVCVMSGLRSTRPLPTKSIDRRYTPGPYCSSVKSLPRKNKTYSKDTEDVQLLITNQQHRNIAIKSPISNLLISPTSDLEQERTYLDKLSFSFQ